MITAENLLNSKERTLNTPRRHNIWAELNNHYVIEAHNKHSYTDPNNHFLLHSSKRRDHHNKDITLDNETAVTSPRYVHRLQHFDLAF